MDIFSRLGVPEEMLSDLGTQLVSDCMREATRLLSIKQLTTTPYHPVGNGFTEKLNGTMKSMLNRLCSEQPRQRHHYINPLLFAYREVPQESTGFPRFELINGRAVRGPMTILKQLWMKEVEEPKVKNVTSTFSRGERSYKIPLNSPIVNWRKPSRKESTITTASLKLGSFNQVRKCLCCYLPTITSYLCSGKVSLKLVQLSRSQ